MRAALLFPQTKPQMLSRNNYKIFEMLPLFDSQDNKDLYAEEAAAQRERERQRMLSIPGLVAPSELQDEMVDS